MGRHVFTAILPGVSLPPYLSTISTAAVVSSTSFYQHSLQITDEETTGKTLNTPSSNQVVSSLLISNVSITGFAQEPSSGSRRKTSEVDVGFYRASVMSIRSLSLVENRSQHRPLHCWHKERCTPGKIKCSEFVSII